MPHPQDTVHRAFLCTRRKPTQYVVVYRDCPNRCQLFFADRRHAGARARQRWLKPAPGAGFGAIRECRKGCDDPQSRRSRCIAYGPPRPEKWLLERLSGPLPEDPLWERFSKQCVESPVTTARFASCSSVRASDRVRASKGAPSQCVSRMKNGATRNHIRIAPFAIARIIPRSSVARYGRRR